MSKLNTAMNVLGTVATLKSIFGGSSSGAGGKINNFMTEIRSSGVARTNLFEVVLTAPRVLSGNPVAEKISLYAEGAVLPGMNLQTQEVNRFGYGPQEKVPYTLQTNDITLNFIGDGRGEIYKFFYRWMQNIVRADNGVTSNKVSSLGLEPYEVEFKSEYRSTMTITTFNEQGDAVLSYELTDAFPLNVPDVALNWSESNMMQFSVQFAFLQSKLTTAEQSLELTQNGFAGLSPLQQLIKVGTAAQVISSLRKPRSIQDALNVSSSIKNIFN